MNKIEQLVSDAERTVLGRKVIELSRADVYALITNVLNLEGHPVEDIEAYTERRFDADGYSYYDLEKIKVYIPRQ